MRNIRRRLHRAAAGQRGVSMIETLVALSLLALCMAGVTQLITLQARYVTRSYLSTQAYTLAAQELESMRTLDYVDMASRSSAETIGTTRYTVATEVVANSPSPNMKRIQVTVSWESFAGPQNVTVATVYSEVRR